MRFRRCLRVRRRARLPGIPDAWSAEPRGGAAAGSLAGDSRSVLCRGVADWQRPWAADVVVGALQRPRRHRGVDRLQDPPGPAASRV